MAWVRGKDGIMYDDKKNKYNLGPSGMTGSYNHGAETAMPDLDKDAIQNMINMSLTDSMKKRENPETGGAGGGYLSKLLGMFGGLGGKAGDDDDDPEKKGGLFNFLGDFDYGKWAPLAQGYMKYAAGKEKSALGREQNKTARRIQQFTEDAYMGEQKRGDALEEDNRIAANDKRGFLNKYLVKQGREDDQVQMLKQRDYTVA